MRVAIVVAARNEENNIAQVVRLARAFGDVIVVDDASSDGTAALASDAGATVLRHPRRTHIRQAYVDGFREAVRRGYDCVVQMDAGFSHDPTQIPRLLDALEGGADLAIGSRFVRGGTSLQHPRRRALSAAGRLLVAATTGMPFTDPTGGFKAYRAPLLREMDGALDDLRARAHAFQFELTYRIWRRGYRIKEVPISHVSSGKSVDWCVVWEALQVALSLR